MRSRLAVLPVAAVVVIAACGAGSRLSKQELVAKANAICRELDGRFQALGTPRTMKDLGRFADRALPIAREGRDRLGKLRPPKEVESTYGEWLGEGDKAVDAIIRVRDAAAKNDVAAVQKVGREARAEDRKSDRLAMRLGFTDCAQQ
jgi:hypothetical protein